MKTHSTMPVIFKTHSTVPVISIKYSTVGVISRNIKCSLPGLGDFFDANDGRDISRGVALRSNLVPISPRWSLTNWRHLEPTLLEAPPAIALCRQYLLRSHPLVSEAWWPIHQLERRQLYQCSSES
jgi:hypothetical protein